MKTMQKIAFSFEPVKECVLNSFYIRMPRSQAYTYIDVVEAVRKTFLDLSAETIQLRSKGETDAISILVSKCSAITTHLMRICHACVPEHKASEYADLSSAYSWNDYFAHLVGAKNSEVPSLGQTGIFDVTVGGYDYRVKYSPFSFGGMHDHLEFYHLKDGQMTDMPCPLTNTGYQSAYLPVDAVDFYKSVDIAATVFITDNQSSVPVEPIQRELF